MGNLNLTKLRKSNIMSIRNIVLSLLLIYVLLPHEVVSWESTRLLQQRPRPCTPSNSGQSRYRYPSRRVGPQIAIIEQMEPCKEGEMVTKEEATVDDQKNW